LLQCSLIEQQYSCLLECNEYQCSPIVIDWLTRPDNLLRGAAALSVSIFQLAALYQKHLFDDIEQKRTIDQAIVVYHAIIAAELAEKAYRFALDAIVEPLTRLVFTKLCWTNGCLNCNKQVMQKPKPMYWVRQVHCITV
jgi:hypothetical protein